MTDPAPSETDLAHADIGLVAALPIETGAFLDRCDRVRKYTGGDFTFRGGIYDGIRIAVAHGGMGFAKARRATTALIDAHSPEWVLSCGLCGGLTQEMKIGDVVVADSIVDMHGQELSIDVHFPSNADKGWHVGRLVTADAMVRTVQEKRELHEKHAAIAVDMESLAVAQVCREAKVKFMAIRAVSDDLAADLPPEVLSLVGESGSMRWGAALGAVWKRPGSMKVMWQLRENANLAAERLASFLHGVVTQLHPKRPANQSEG